MSENWEDILKSKLESLERPLPDGDLARFMDRLETSENSRSKDTRGIMYGIAFTLAAAVLALCLLLPHSTRRLETQENLETAIVITSAPAQTPEQAPAAAPALSGPVATATSTASTVSKPEAPVTRIVSDEPGPTPEQESSVTPIVTDEQGQSPEKEKEVKPAAKEKKEKSAGKYSADDFRPNDYDQSEKNRKRNVTVITTSAGAFTTAALLSLIPKATNGIMSNSQYDSFPASAMSDKIIGVTSGTIPATDYSHCMPLIVSMSVRYPITDRLSLNSGLNYSLYHSSYQKSYIACQQDVHYLGIPLRVDYDFIDRRFLSAYVGAGASIDWCLGAFENGMNVGSDIPCISLDAAAGLQFNISERFGIFVEPSIGWLIPTGTRYIRTWRTDNTVYFYLPFGLRYTINTKRK